MRQDVGYILLVLLVLAVIAGGVIYARYRQREHARIWGRNKRRRR